jgi:hypothetical protein
MKKLLLFVLALLASTLLPPAANAEPTDPIVRGNFNVEVIGKGKVTGTSIDCPGDCSADSTWRESEIPPKNRLTAIENATGWTFQGWSGGCTLVPANPRLCDGIYGEELGINTYVATFADTERPWVALGPLQKTVVSNSIWAGVTASDNERVTRIEYLIDGGVLISNTTGPWPRDLDLSGIAVGVHTIQARAFDAAGNSTTTAAQTFEIERTPPEITIDSPQPATNAAVPALSFTPVSEDFESATCNILATGDSPNPLFPCQAGQPYDRGELAEGEWRFWVRAVDRAGNTKEFSQDFVVDRTAPELTITSGPADGDTVQKGDVKYGWTVSDATAVTQKCSWDAGEKAACDLTASKGLKKGDHTFVVEATDLAGNVTTVSRTVKVLSDGTIPDPGKNPNDPGKPGGDTTAPVIKLASPKQRLKALRKGLKVRVTCSEACAGKLVAKPAKTAKATRGIKFNAQAKLAGAGTVMVKLKPSAKARKKLKKLKKPLKLIVRTNLADPSGNSAGFTLKTRTLR